LVEEVILAPWVFYSLVLLDILDAPSLVTKALRGNIAAEAFDKLHGPAGDMLGKGYHVNALQDEVVRLHGIRGTKWWAVP